MIRRQPAAGAALAAPAAHSRPPGGPGGPTAGVGPLLALPRRLAFLGRVSTVDQQDPTLSIPRQLRNAHAALPPGAEIVAHFYDVESGRKDLDERGLGVAHERFAIPVPRDGGLGDLLAEAARPDRRFDGVICESIERVARRTYDGTKVEHDLERVGVALLTIKQRRYTYYTCRPAEAHGPRAHQLWPDHPNSIAVREDYLLDGILDFFAKTVFHPERHQRLPDQLATADVHSLRAAERQRAALQRTIDDLDARARRLVRALELNTALDGDSGAGAAFAEVRGRLAELQRQREAAARELAALPDQWQPADGGAAELLDALPVGTVTLQGVPEPTLRRLFVAFQLQVRYDKHANWATLQVTLQEDRLDELLLAVAGAITDPQQPPAHGDGTADGPPFAHAVPVPGGTGNAWATHDQRKQVIG